MCDRPRQRGVVLVEAAFTFPIFVALLMAVVEFGLFMNDYLAVAQATRAGSRAASAAGADPRADLYTMLKFAQESTALNRNDIDYVVVYKADTDRNGVIDPMASLPAACFLGNPVSGFCNVYRASDLAVARAQVNEESRHAQELANGNTADVLNTNLIWFGCLTTGPHANSSPDRFWCPTTRDDSLKGTQDGTDYVGIYVQAQHKWATKMFGTSRTIKDQSVVRLEPRKQDDI